jgi:hypothetical protein
MKTRRRLTGTVPEVPVGDAPEGTPNDALTLCGSDTERPHTLWFGHRSGTSVSGAVRVAASRPVTHHGTSEWQPTNSAFFSDTPCQSRAARSLRGGASANKRAEMLAERSGGQVRSTHNVRRKRQQQGAVGQHDRHCRSQRPPPAIPPESDDPLAGHSHPVSCLMRISWASCSREAFTDHG